MPVKTRDAASKKPARKAAPKRSADAPKRSRKPASAGDEVVTIDRRRGARRGEERVAAQEPALPTPAPKLERRAKTQRRRQIDPTTCERDYSIDEVEFMNAMDDYKRKSGRMFPTCSEVLEVIRGLGYVKLSPTGRAMFAADAAQDPMIDSDLVSSRS